MSTYPEGPIVAEKSISRERALHMAHFPELYQKAYNEKAMTLPGGNSGQGWRNFLENPANYQRSLTAFALGAGINHKGEWMSAYMNGSKIPMHRIASKASKPTEIRVKEPTNKGAKASAAALQNALNAMRQDYKQGAPEHIMEAHHLKIDNLESDAQRHRKSMKTKWVTFEEYVANHDNYFSPLGVDDAHFKKTFPVHEAHTRKHDFAYHMKDNKDPLSVEKVRDGAAMLLGKAPESLEGSSAAVYDQVVLLSAPSVVRSEDGLPLIAYGMNSLTTGELLREMIVQSPTGDGYDVEEVGKHQVSNVTFTTLDDAISSINPAPSSPEPTQTPTVKDAVRNDEFGARGLTRR